MSSWTIQFYYQINKKKNFVINPNKNQPLLIQFDQKIRTKCHTTCLISYIPCLRWHSTWRDLFKAEKLKYQICRLTSCFNCLINFNQKIFILSRFVAKNDLFMFDQKIRTKCHTTCLISYIPCLRWHSTWRDLFINNSVLLSK
jgi:hypothetical protein